MKTRPVGAEMFPADDGQTYTRQTVAFRNSANALKKNHLQVQKKVDICH
jgi:hypothetical protein